MNLRLTAAVLASFALAACWSSSDTGDACTASTSDSGGGLAARREQRRAGHVDGRRTGLGGTRARRTPGRMRRASTSTRPPSRARRRRSVPTRGAPTAARPAGHGGRRPTARTARPPRRARTRATRRCSSPARGRIRCASAPRRRTVRSDPTYNKCSPSRKGPDRAQRSARASSSRRAAAEPACKTRARRHRGARSAPFAESGSVSRNVVGALGFALHRDVAAVRDRELARDVKAEPRALDAATEHGVGAAEAREQARHLVGRDPLAFVAHVDERGVARATDRDRHRRRH